MSGGMPMPGGWTMSMAWMRMPGQGWVGAEAEGMGVYKDEALIVGKTRIYHLLVGPKLYPLGHRKVTPFGHFLVGIARYSNTTPAYGGYPSTSRAASAYAWEAGGGLDWNLSPHWGVRLFQLDFGHENFFGGSTGNTRISRRLAAGFGSRFGDKEGCAPLAFRTGLREGGGSYLPARISTAGRLVFGL